MAAGHRRRVAWCGSTENPAQDVARREARGAARRRALPSLGAAVEVLPEIVGIDVDVARRVRRAATSAGVVLVVPIRTPSGGGSRGTRCTCGSPPDPARVPRPAPAAGAGSTLHSAGGTPLDHQRGSGRTHVSHRERPDPRGQAPVDVGAGRPPDAHSTHRLKGSGAALCLTPASPSRLWRVPVSSDQVGTGTVHEGGGMSQEFAGKIKLDVRDSVPDWTPYELPGQAPRRAERPGRAVRRHRPGRVVAVRRAHQHADAWKLADNGLTYSQWHTTALCSPTRSTFLTGRNHHVNRCASIMEGADGFPGAAGRLPAECATIGQVLQDNGYSTFWLGKNHNVPEEDIGQRRQQVGVAAAEGLRPLLRVPRRRDQQLVSRPGRGQPLHRAAVHARGGLPPVEGPRRPGAPDAARPAGVEPVQAVVHVVLPGCQPRAAPRARGVRRQVQGQVRRRLRGLPRVGAARG